MNDTTNLDMLAPQRPTTRLPSGDGLIERCHTWTKRDVAAVNAAIASGRPLLIKGEPGVGKSQLADAVAVELKRAFWPFVVDSRTESRDLLYHFDAVRRLAEAQLCNASGLTHQEASDRLAVATFVSPGPLWVAFDPTGAAEHVEKFKVEMPNKPWEQARNKDRNGWVLLIDEIDKAETDVPNGLLEALGANEFRAMGAADSIRAKPPAPLIVITSNDERALPDAFERRCVVLHMALPGGQEDLIRLLEQRGREHFPDQAAAEDTGEGERLSVFRVAAEMVAKDRRAAQAEKLHPTPGQAEYLDLLRAVFRLYREIPRQLEALEELADFVVRKPKRLQDTSRGNESLPGSQSSDS